MPAAAGAAGFSSASERFSRFANLLLFLLFLSIGISYFNLLEEISKILVNSPHGLFRRDDRKDLEVNNVAPLRHPLIE